MHLPGFSAGASIGPARRRYRSSSSSLSTERVEPALMLGQRSAVRLLAGLGLGGRLGFSCGGGSCTCAGDADCNDMFSTDVCGDVASCQEGPDGSVTCACLRF